MNNETFNIFLDSKRWLWLLTFVILCIFFVHYNVFYLTSSFEGDIGRDLYNYLLVSEGKLPYIDFNWIYGPVMPLVYGSIFKVFGASIHNALQVWYLLLILSTFLIYFVVKNFSNRFFGFLAGTCFILFYGFFIYTFNHIGALPALIISFYLIYLYIKEEKPKYLYMLAVIYAVLAIIKLNMALAFSVPTYLTFYIYHLINKKTVRHVVYSNLLIILIPFIVYGVFISKAPLDQFYKWFPYSGQRHSENSYALSELLFASEVLYVNPIAKESVFYYIIHRIADLMTYYFIIPIAGFAYSLFAIFKKTNHVKDYTILLIFSLSTILSTHEFILVATSYSLRLWTLPGLLITLFYFLSILINNYQNKKLFKPAVIVLFTIMTLIICCKITLHSLYSLEKTYYCPLDRARVSFSNLSWYIHRLKALEYIDDHLAKDEMLFSFPYDMLNNFLSKRPYPTRIMEFIYVSQVNDSDQQKVIEDLEKNRVKNILYSSKFGDLDKGLGIFGQTHCKKLFNYLNSNYQLNYELNYKKKNYNNNFDITFYTRSTPFKKYPKPNQADKKKNSER